MNGGYGTESLLEVAAEVDGSGGEGEVADVDGGGVGEGAGLGVGGVVVGAVPVEFFVGGVGVEEGGGAGWWGEEEGFGGHGL